jgi:hypothetical protein
MEFAPSEHEPCVRCLQLGIGLCQPDFVGVRIDGEEEIALMDDVPILEVYSGKRAADLGAQLDLAHGRELAQELDPGADVALQRCADGNARQRSSRGRTGGRRQQARPGNHAAGDQAEGQQGNAPSPDAGLRGMLAGDGPSAYVRHFDLAISSISSYHIYR